MIVESLHRRLAMTCLVLACVNVADASDLTGEARTLTSAAGIEIDLGPRRTLLSDGALGLHYFPDEAISVLEQGPRLRLLVTAADTSYVLEGADLARIDRATPVLRPGPAGSFDNGYAGISGVHHHPDGKVYAFYHAEDHEGLPSQPGSYPGFYASIGAAVSSDKGRTWRKLGRAITSEKPKSWALYPTQSDRGVATPSVVLDRGGKYLLAYYTEHSRVDARGVVVCVARADVSTEPPIPGRWRKYHDGRFSEPGLGGQDTRVISIPPADETSALQPHVVFSRDLDRYVMVLNVAWWRESLTDAPLRRSGIYVAFSDDGIRWSKPEQLITDHSLPVVGKSLSWEATILWDAESTTRGWLVYGYSERWGAPEQGGIPHYMVGRRIELRPVASGQSETGCTVPATGS